VTDRADSRPRIAVLLRRLCDTPGHVDEDEVLGRCERAALAAALVLRSELGATVTAIAMGPPTREDRVLAMSLRAGCDHAVRVYDGHLAEVDYLGVAQILAAAVAKTGFDLILCGDRSQDQRQGATGPAVAQLLDIPHLGRLVDLRADGDRIVCTRRAAGALHELSCGLPALLCVASFPADRRPADGDDSGSRDGVIEELSLDALDIDGRALAHRGRLVGITRERHPGANATLVTSPADLVKRLERDRILG
jgi:electron transfer flavoprotein beta subunit